MLDNFIFQQERVGENGNPLTVRKIRTMDGRMDNGVTTVLGRMAEQTPERERVSLLGAVLRHLGLDEIPQLWNVFRGEMQLIGIRPMLPEEVDLLPPDIRVFYLSHRPGLFPGHLAFGQVNGHLDRKMALIREFMQLSDELDGLRGNTKIRVLVLIGLLGKIYFRKLTDDVSIELIRERINRMINLNRSSHFAE